jgi:hypothetical protein
MSTITLTLKIFTLKGIVIVCRITGESLQRSFLDECMEPHERRAIFAQWIRVKWNMDLAERLLDQESHYKTLISVG